MKFSTLLTAALVLTGTAFQACSSDSFSGKKAVDALSDKKDKESGDAKGKQPDPKGSPAPQNPSGDDGTGNEGLKSDGKLPSTIPVVEKTGWNSGLPECEKLVLAPGKSGNAQSGGSSAGGWGAVSSSGNMSGDIPKCVEKEVLDAAKQYVFCELEGNGKVKKCYPWEAHPKSNGLATGGAAYAQCASTAGSTADNRNHCSASACCFKTK